MISSAITTSYSVQLELADLFFHAKNIPIGTSSASKICMTFSRGLTARDLLANPCVGLDGLVDQYNSDLAALLEEHACFTQDNSLISRLAAPWLNDSIL